MKVSNKIKVGIILTIIVLGIFPFGTIINAARASSSGTFGITSTGANVIGTGGIAAKTGGYFQLATAGTVTKITAYIRGSGIAKAAIYSDLNGQPNLPIGGATQQASVPSTAGWVDFTYSTPVSLQAGYYWLTLIYDSNCNWFFSSGGTSAWNWITYTNEPISPFGSHTSRTDAISIYATYTTSGSSGTTGTFGVSTAGSSAIGTGGAAAKTGAYFQLATAGTVTKLTAYIRGSGYAKAAIYSDLNGQPNLPIGGATQQASVPSTAGWVDFTYSTPVSLQAGYYWLTLIYDSNCNWFFSSGGTSAWNWITYSNEPASPFGSHTSRTDAISIYATYTTGSNPTPTPSPTPTPTGSTYQFQNRGANVPINVFVPGCQDYNPNAWQLLKDLNINLIRVLPGDEGDSMHININYDANWAQNLNNFLTQASNNGIRVFFDEMGTRYGPSLLLGIVPYGETGATPIATAQTMIDKLAGNNALGHNFITDPRMYGWSTSNEQDLGDANALNWNIQILDYIRSYGGKAWVAAPYDSTIGDYWTATQYVSKIGSHVDMIELHNYGEYEYVKYFAKDTKSYYSWNSLYDYMKYYYQQMLSSSFPADRLIIGEFGMWQGYGTYEGLSQGVTFNAQDRVNAYSDTLNAGLSAGIKNMCFFNMFSQTNEIPDYGVVKDPASGSGYWDNNLANTIRTAYTS